jgi:hypothetical protein
MYIPERGCGTKHILAECSHHAVRTRAIAYDIGCAEYEADDQADSFDPLAISDEMVVGTHTAAHHCTHFRCSSLVVIVEAVWRLTIPLSKVEGPTMPPLDDVETGGIVTINYK